MKKSKRKLDTQKRKLEESKGISHVISGFPDFDPKRKDFGMKGTEIRGGVRSLMPRPLEPDESKGVEIKKHFKG